MVAKQAGQVSAKVSSAMSGVRRAADAVSSSASKRFRTGFMEASMAQAGKSSSPPSPPSYQNVTVERDVKEVEEFKQMPLLPIVEDGHYG